jgi:hypothetical protein
MIARATLALAVLAAVASEPAYAEIWCIREAGSVGPGACVFPSAEDCGRAARLNPFGGVCERQPMGLNGRAEDRSATGRRAARPKAANP